MAIKGLTDQGKKSFPRLGVIRKGAPKEKYKDAQGKEKSKIGRDLTFFRFDSPDAAANDAFLKSYGKEPKMIHVVLPYRTPEENFQTCKEAHLAGGILHRCDGETTSILRTPKGITTEPHKCPGGCKEVGRLMVVIPEMLKSLHRLAYVTVLTSSKNDLVELSANLEAIYGFRGSLQGIPLVLRRVEREVSCPADDKGGRAKRKKWMLSIEPAENFVKAYLEASEREVIAAPTERMMLAAAPKQLPAFANPEHALAAQFQNTTQVMEPVASDFGTDIPDEEEDDDSVVTCISGETLSTAVDLYAVLKDKGRNGAKFTEWLENNYKASSLDCVAEDDGPRLISDLNAIIAKIEADEAKTKKSNKPFAA